MAKSQRSPSRGLISASNRQMLYRVAHMVWPWLSGAAITGAAFLLAEQQAAQINAPEAVSALKAWIAVVAVMGTARLVFRYLHDASERARSFYQNTPDIFRGLQYWIAEALAVVYTVILGVFRLPYFLLFPGIFIFVPGLIILSHRFSPFSQPGSFPRPVTRRALVYSGIAVISVGWAALRLADDGSWIVLAAPPILCAGLLMTIYALMRVSDLSRWEGEMMTAQFEKIVQQEDYLKLWLHAARLVQQHFRYHRVVIICPDERYRESLYAGAPELGAKFMGQVQFRIAGIFGEKIDQLETLIYPARGIALDVLKTGKSKIVSNVNDHGFYYADGLKDTQSELYVPVMDLARPAEVIAIIVAQDSHRNAFTQADRANMERVAGYMATFSRHVRHEAGYQHLQNMTATLQQGDQMLFGDMVALANEVFRTRCISCVPLSFATYLPEPWRAQTHPDGFATSFRFDQRWLAWESGIPELIYSWQPVLITDFSSDAPLSRFWKALSESENLRALALIPVGARSGLGALFIVGFREDVSSESKYLLTQIGAFANILATQIDRQWQQWWRYEKSFVAPTAEVHQLLNVCELGRGNYQWILDQIGRGELNETQNLRTNLETLIKGLYDMEAMSHPLNGDASLIRSVEEFANGLQGRYKFDGIRRFDDRIEKESLELKSMLFRIICEAMINALAHGKASLINLIVSRRMDEIVVLIHDNGAGFDPGKLPEFSERRHGILALTHCLAELTGAKSDWLWTSPGAGACLKVTVPSLRLNPENDELDGEIEQKLAKLENLYQ